ncbi:MAG: hypothetical protein ACO3A2_07635 [Bdellovibrionia bacterium]
MMVDSWGNTDNKKNHPCSKAKKTKGTQLSFHIVSFLFVLTPIFLTSVLFGCKPITKSGLYEGSLFTRTESEAKKQPVRLDLQFTDPYHGQLEVRDLHQTILKTIQIHWERSQDALTLHIPELTTEPIRLTRFSESDQKSLKCYQGGSTPHLSLCLEPQKLFLHAFNETTHALEFSLTGDFAPQQKEMPFEEPKTYSLNEASQLILEKNFDSRIEYQKVIEAREAAKVALLNLLPHFYFKDLLAISSLNPTSIANYIADFVPFVIPTRWLKVKQAKDLREVEEISLAILKADLTYQMNNLSWILNRDRSTLEYYEHEKLKLAEAYAHSYQIGGDDIGQLGKPIDELEFRFSVVGNFIDQEIIRLENSVLLDRTALSLSLGFTNPMSVEGIQIENESLNLQDAQEMRADEVAKMALERSLELRQLDYLIDNATRQKQEYYFNWLDPDVAPAMSISTSLVPLIRKAKAIIKQLSIKREKTYSEVAQNAENAVINYNYALKAFKKVEQGLGRLQAREQDLYLEILRANHPGDIRMPPVNIQWAISTAFQFKIQFFDALARAQIARAKIKRMLYEDYYAQLMVPKENKLE